MARRIDLRLPEQAIGSGPSAAGLCVHSGWRRSGGRTDRVPAPRRRRQGTDRAEAFLPDLDGPRWPPLSLALIVPLLSSQFLAQLSPDRSQTNACAASLTLPIP
jgi:hypothetical protein